MTNEPATEPTAEGKLRWAPDGFYDGEPCTCKPECPHPCKGHCGCDACNAAYMDYLSMPEE